MEAGEFRLLQSKRTDETATGEFRVTRMGRGWEEDWLYLPKQQQSQIEVENLSSPVNPVS